MPAGARLKGGTLKLETYCHIDSILNYISDTGENWQMKLKGDHFVHAPNGDHSRAHTEVMHYIGWDGRK